MRAFLFLLIKFVRKLICYRLKNLPKARRLTFLSLGLVFITSCASLETKEVNTKVDKIPLFNETAFSYQDLKDIVEKNKGLWQH